MRKDKDKERMNMGIKNEDKERIVDGLIRLDRCPPNLIDIRALYLLGHVIYRGIEDYGLKCELNAGYLKLIEEAKLLDLSIPEILIECVTGGKYQGLMPSILKEHWSQFILSLEYIINPSSDMEDHIPSHYLDKAEANAKQLMRDYI